MAWSSIGWDGARFLLELAAVLFAAITASFALLRSAMSGFDKKMEAIKGAMEKANVHNVDRIDHLDSRVGRLEVAVEALPTSQSLEQVRREVVALQGALGRVDVEIKATAAAAARIDSSVQRIESFLLARAQVS